MRTKDIEIINFSDHSCKPDVAISEEKKNLIMQEKSWDDRKCHQKGIDRNCADDLCRNLVKILKSKLLSRTSKILLYHSYLCPIVTYACDSVTRHEIEQQTKYSIAFIRNKRLEWFGHTWSCYGLLIKKVLVEKINKTRPLGRPRTRWIDVINRHLREIGQNNLEKPLS
ncbi:Reverse transcriptase domain-containing protein [Aphis craccivora]|uniref:Reverse transcriptase domain-containing protein n=1 Tax=Aphis craccivora TaxID=307492 RepID=A0A6G0YWH8_APHCR|nr:Reverse transcriptase domain-containing protein [Aphis craccivora]